MYISLGHMVSFVSVEPNEIVNSKFNLKIDYIIYLHFSHR
jgi:hypothetical protein